ncbi:alpha/beta fold hydrolase [Pseudothauera nasutitermitis]|uniref:Alpha/beta fold hydrolase n=1 Tax=Pseudothauera nasutitermitis TaxID=2565930 RepID=A0A4S4B1Z1_9RHOO|nr:alpha/beta fold hydrolase [Pseudothauera nasutitermitis]THF66205.1 alpha/beta fold hydrolase [Pseudothauera nasutitermitis]
MSRPLVLLHGWGLTARVWETLRAPLAGLTIHAPDLPGHGSAPAVSGTDLAAWTDRLAADLPDGATVCGWSLGALLALDFAARHPRKVARLALIGATPRFAATEGWPHALDAETVAAFRDAFTSAPAAVLHRFIALQVLGDAHRREVGGKLTAALSAAEPDAAQTEALAAGLAVLAGADLRGTLAAIRQPALLLHGEHDALMPVGAARWLAAQWPDARLEILAACGHAPFLSRPAECATLLEGFHRG